ncbi:MAG: DUF4393 domain-containing protein [Bacteroidales bacterium]|nr:DUF4393 domain-containing protein [Bacteroidales bacterium]
MDNSVLDLVKGTPNILGQIYEDLAQPSVKAVGQALGTVFEFSTSFLLPVKLLNEKIKMNFKKRITEYEKKLEEIPEEKRCEVHPQVGTPIIEKLSYTTNDEIADLFTTLLANASNIDMVNTAHPAFISIIERLSPDEARIIKYLKGKEDIQYCDFRGNVKNGNGYNTIIEHATLIPQEVHLAFPKNVNAYLANFVSLGILFDMVGTYRIDQTIYNKIKEFYGFEKLKTQLAPNVFKEVVANNSYYKVTDFGKLFIQACIK